MEQLPLVNHLRLGLRFRSQITAVSPAEIAGAVNITVTTPGGVSATSAADQFTFTTTNSVGVLSGYNAGTGYDRATGVGSVNATALISAFN